MASDKSALLVSAAISLCIVAFVPQPGLSRSAKKVPSISVDWKVEMAEGERRLENQDLARAETSFSQALKDVKRDKSSTKDEIAGCMIALGQVMRRQGKFEEVWPLYKKALRLQERAHGKESAVIVPTLVLMADTLEGEDEFKKSIKFYDRALAVSAKTIGTNTLTYADYQHRLGHVMYENGQVRQAEDLYRASLTTLMGLPELPSTTVLELVLADYIDLFMKSPDVHKTLASQFQRELLKDNLQNLERTKGVAQSSWNREVSARLANQANSQAQGLAVSSPAAATTSPIPGNGINLARIPSTDPVALEAINKQRIDFYERMIEIDIKTLGADHPSVARDLYGLAAIYLSQNKYDAAKPLLLRALSVYEKAYDQNALLVQRTRNLLNMIDRQQNPEAEDIGPLDYTAGLPRIPLAAQKLEIALRMNYLAFLAYSYGRVSDAATFYAWALADTAAASGEESMLAATCLTDYGRVLRSQGKGADAERMEAAAQRIIRRSMAKQAALAKP